MQAPLGAALSPTDDGAADGSAASVAVGATDCTGATDPAGAGDEFVAFDVHAASAIASTIRRTTGMWPFLQSEPRVPGLARGIRRRVPDPTGPCVSLPMVASIRRPHGDDLRDPSPVLPDHAGGGPRHPGLGRGDVAGPPIRLSRPRLVPRVFHVRAEAATAGSRSQRRGNPTVLERPPQRSDTRAPGVRAESGAIGTSSGDVQTIAGVVGPVGVPDPDRSSKR